MTPRWTPPAPRVGTSLHRAQAHRRWIGWVVVGVLGLLIAGLAFSSMHAPVVSAAGNPLYLHGSGASPACVPSSIDRTVGSRLAPCSVGDAVANFAFASLPAQTIPAGTWTFTLYWTTGVPVALSNVRLSVGVVNGAGCAAFAPLFTWAGTYGTGANPATFSTAAPQVNIAAGTTLCLRVDLSVEQDDANMIYDTAAAASQLTPPVTVVPESALGFAGLALAIPILTARRRWLSWIRVLS